MHLTVAALCVAGFVAAAFLAAFLAVWFRRRR